MTSVYPNSSFLHRILIGSLGLSTRPAAHKGLCYIRELILHRLVNTVMAFNCSEGFDLLDRLTREGDYRLILIISTEDSRRTALLQEWGSRREKSRQPFGWLSLEPADNLPAHFQSSLEAALDKGLNGASISARNLGTRIERREAEEDAVIEHINRLVEAPPGFTLAFDCYHAITSPEVHTAVQLLLDYLPPQVHLLIASRKEPPLQLARLRVRRQLVEIHMDEIAT